MQSKEISYDGKLYNEWTRPYLPVGSIVEVGKCEAAIIIGYNMNDECETDYVAVDMSTGIQSYENHELLKFDHADIIHVITCGRRLVDEDAFAELFGKDDFSSFQTIDHLRVGTIVQLSKKFLMQEFHMKDYQPWMVVGKKDNSYFLVHAKDGVSNSFESGERIEVEVSNIINIPKEYQTFSTKAPCFDRGFTSLAAYNELWNDAGFMWVNEGGMVEDNPLLPIGTVVSLENDYLTKIGCPYPGKFLIIGIGIEGNVYDAVPYPRVLISEEMGPTHVAFSPLHIEYAFYTSVINKQWKQFIRTVHWTLMYNRSYKRPFYNKTPQLPAPRCSFPKSMRRQWTKDDLRKMLPQGSIVEVKDYGTLMVIALCEENYDYVGVRYPEGFDGDIPYFMFNKEDIEKVVREKRNKEWDEFIEDIHDSYFE